MSSRYVIRRIEERTVEDFLERVKESVEIRLKRCPFCGGRGHNEQRDHEEYEDCRVIICEDCGAQTKEAESLEQAVELWNARV